ncbi:hypothetical protein HGRIS_007952 [Hohenbuehelia grisea]|uniref:Uncharacterized protein n=1 Tax=Hohenbuehelia grisea TaxID=104357 RepID=A0ABR3J6V4_9AGAR
MSIFKRQASDSSTDAPLPTSTESSSEPTPSPSPSTPSTPNTEESTPPAPPSTSDMASSESSSSSSSSSSISSSSSVSSSSSAPPPPPSSSSEPPPPPSSSSSTPDGPSSSSSPDQPPPSSSNPPDPPPSSAPPPPSSESASPSPTAFPSQTATLSTLQSTVFVTTTNSVGQSTIVTPTQVTAVVTLTDSLGVTLTYTSVFANPTLGSDNHRGSGSAFFANTGAVAAVFTLTGLAAMSILLFIVFAIRRRRRNLKLEHDTAVSASLAAAGVYRSPLDDDDDPARQEIRSRSRYGSPELEMGHRSSSGHAIGTAGSRLSAVHSSHSGPYLDSPVRENPPTDEGYNPYSDYSLGAGGAAAAALAREGYYTAARTSSPPPPPGAYGGYAAHYNDNSAGSHSQHGSTQDHGHAGQRSSHSAGSYEPLLGDPFRSQGVSPSGSGLPSPSLAAPLPVLPPRNPRRLSERKTEPPLFFDAPVAAAALPGHDGSSVYSSESTDDRLDPGMRERMGNASNVDIRDEHDYSRPVLGVRNLPDGASHTSRDS